MSHEAKELVVRSISRHESSSAVFGGVPVLIPQEKLQGVGDRDVCHRQAARHDEGPQIGGICRSSWSNRDNSVAGVRWCGLETENRHPARFPLRR